MTPIPNTASEEALKHAGLTLAAVYAGLITEGGSLRFAELTVAVALAVLVLVVDAWGRCVGTSIVAAGPAPVRLDAGAPPTSPTRPGASAPSRDREDHRAPPGCD